MKALLSLIMVVSAFASLNTEARTVIGALEAKITSANIDEEDERLDRMGVGLVKVNFIKGYIGLYLRENVRCLPNQRCMSPRMFKKELKLVERYVDACGSNHYIAKRDMRLADGALEVLHIQDNRPRKCRDLRPPTEIEYTTLYDSRVTFGYRSTFTAEYLTPVSPL